MNTIEVIVNVDTAPIDSLITKLERAVELQKQLTQEPLQTKKAALADLINVTPAVLGVVVSWNVWWPGKARVYSKYRRGDEAIEMCSRPISNLHQAYLVNGLIAGQDIECHVRFCDNDGRELFRSATVTGKASSDASEILYTLSADTTYQCREAARTQYNVRAGISIEGGGYCSGIVTAAKIEPSLASIKELQDNVAAIITNATDTQHQLERIDHQRNEDFVSLSKAVRLVEESISQLSHRDSFIR
ncbi:hypothetical protein [Yersinia proxima]|uniref:hypothetical protein n=1 Tax=Yersinia proxima TaxID=2890316 RepID=UPI001D11BB5B|nr:hypothetical protein [Yersinia proxima]